MKALKRLDGTMWFIIAFALSGAVLCLVLKGGDVFVDALLNGFVLLARLIPILAGGVLLGGILQVLVPASAVKRWMGEGSGWRGLFLATAIGTLVPGGPVTSFPLVAALVAAGAEFGVTIAFLTSWATLGLNRVIVWEIPFMGGDFALTRYLASLPLPILAGLAARWLSRLAARR